MAPWSVVVATILQYSTAATFVVMSLMAYRSGLAAQEAARAEVARQGHPPELLVRGRVNFQESGGQLALPLGIALALAVLGTLNLAGSEVARATTWVFHLLLLVLGGYVTGAQVFAVRFVESAFRKSGDDDLRRIDVERLMAAATLAFPAWFRPVVVARFVLVTLGSVLVMISLALPSTSAHFR